MIGGPHLAPRIPTAPRHATLRFQARAASYDPARRSGQAWSASKPHCLKGGAIRAGSRADARSTHARGLPLGALERLGPGFRADRGDEGGSDSLAGARAFAQAFQAACPCFAPDACARIARPSPVCPSFSSALKGGHHFPRTPPKWQRRAVGRINVGLPITSSNIGTKQCLGAGGPLTRATGCNSR